MKHAPPLPKIDVQSGGASHVPHTSHCPDGQLTFAAETFGFDISFPYCNTPQKKITMEVDKDPWDVNHDIMLNKWRNLFGLPSIEHHSTDDILAALKHFNLIKHDRIYTGNYHTTNITQRTEQSNELIFAGSNGPVVHAFKPNTKRNTKRAKEFLRSITTQALQSMLEQTNDNTFCRFPAKLSSRITAVIIRRGIKINPINRAKCKWLHQEYLFGGYIQNGTDLIMSSNIHDGQFQRVSALSIEQNMLNGQLWVHCEIKPFLERHIKQAVRLYRICYGSVLLRRGTDMATYKVLLSVCCWIAQQPIL